MGEKGRWHFICLWTQREVEDHRLFADGLLCLLLIHVLFQHPIRSQTVDQHLLKYLTGQLIRETLTEGIAHRRKVAEYYPAAHTQETTDMLHSPEFPGRSAAETVFRTNAE